ncbi:hypothetical protein PILCRDRAFT_812584 [Piloderma croceum F 1598]|uniref:Uncharacterized protein n=1 Tax=Piloderma croceum (strain F 1598) TaxID=765440 RepID=A0A0C3BTB0_PILCF|nr:hypothetical protein PILCRDRAFT_812584 [Piloderma croceum F 1598]
MVDVYSGFSEGRSLLMMRTSSLRGGLGLRLLVALHESPSAISDDDNESETIALYADLGRRLGDGLVFP